MTKAGYVKTNKIQQGDVVLLRRKSTKHKSRYDPDHYLAVQVYGSQIVGEWGEIEKTQDAQRLKLHVGNTWYFRQHRRPNVDPDTNAPARSQEEEPPPPETSTR